MRSADPLLAVAVAAAVSAAGCGSGPEKTAFQAAPGDNVVPISVNGACGATPYVNEPCVSVKVCAPGSTTSCQTIGALLLDTGSYGLRVFREALGQELLAALPAVAGPGGGPLAECVQYADLSADWGPVVTADVVLGNEPAVRVPIQVIDETFATVPASCPSPETAPAAFNGILGVGVFVEDCGPTCPASANMYFEVGPGGAVTAVTIGASRQVQNPVGHLPLDNNGVIVALPPVPAAGARSVDGALVLGIGTRANNVPTAAAAISLDRSGNFTTTLEGGQVLPDSFVDTGSNGLFFAAPSALPPCTRSVGWYCPPSPVSLVATNGPSAGFSGSQLRTPFQIASIDELLRSGNAVFPNVGGAAVPIAGFDFGLPFFLGRTVYLGISGKTTTFGNGPILAY